MGGLSVEREVSLKTGAACADALVRKGYDVVRIDVGRDVAAQLLAHKVEVAFIALHGRYGEDGSIQGLLESMFIPYTGSGVLASAIGMDKIFNQWVFLARGISTPKYCDFPSYEALEKHGFDLYFPFPAVVKP
ncbi:MAG: D-alanine--D-alanine ligase, partial [Myxococcales bacterium]